MGAKHQRPELEQRPSKPERSCDILRLLFTDKTLFKSCPVPSRCRREWLFLSDYVIINPITNGELDMMEKNVKFMRD